MADTRNLNLNYDRPIRIAEGIYWVGFYDAQSKLRCNPYLIIDGDEAVILDSGSRPDFPVVMMKVLQTGVNPKNIKALIYHHYDPDLCGNIPNFEDIIDRDDLMIVSDHQNNIFIRHYGVSSELVTLNKLDYNFVFSSGRRLEFHMTPYAHAGGSFMTYDKQTGVLFTSDLIGSYSKEWDLFLDLEEKCGECEDYKHCPNARDYCPLPDILKFHQIVMPSRDILRHAVGVIRSVGADILAPQHGSVVNDARYRDILLDKLDALEDVGIDRILRKK